MRNITKMMEKDRGNLVMRNSINCTPCYGEMGRTCSTHVDVGTFWNLLLTVNAAFSK